MNFVYFDLETERSADEVGGWRNIEQLGYTVGITQSSRDGEFRVYLKHEIPALVEELCAADCVVGFNTRNFDFRVLQTYSNVDLRTLTDIDLMLDIREVAGFRPGLENCCNATFGENKSGGGLQAIQWWREGRHEEVIEYCKQDVALTRRLHEWGATHGWIKCLDRSGRLRTVSIPWSLEALTTAPQQGSLF